MDENIYPIYKIATLNQLLGEWGLPENILLEGTSLNSENIKSNTTRISLRQVRAIYRRAVTITTNPAIGLMAGQRLGMTNYGIYGYAMISSASLREALLLSIKYHQMATPTVRMSLHDDKDYASFRFHDQLRRDVIYAFNIELQFSLTFSLFKDMIGNDFRYSSVCAKFPKPDYAALYKDIFECEASFRQEFNELRFDKSWLDKPLARANPITAATTRELCDQVLLEMQTREGLAHQVYEVITEDIRLYNKIDHVADRLHMSSRTLRRKLTLQDTTYQKILVEVRRQLAIEFLRHTKFSSEEIADRLGFADAANFRHAFKRWTNKSTSQYRQ